MTAKKRISRIDGLTAEIVAGAEKASRRRSSAFTTTQEEIKRLWRRDYGPSIRKCLGRAEVREVVSAAKRKAWPHLNEDAVRLGSMREFANRASVLGADFRIARMSWPSGLALFGFYLGSDSGLEKRPLICVNGAHHRAAIGTAFLHEVGHHVTAKLFSNRSEPVQLSRLTGYEAHLSDPRELAADIMVSLGIYPHDTAARVFDDGTASSVVEGPDGQLGSQRIEKALIETGRRYGLDLDSLPRQKQLQYQAGLIHFTRLREALFEEYDL
jgi:hypothetical protein